MVVPPLDRPGVGDCRFRESVVAAGGAPCSSARNGHAFAATDDSEVAVLPQLITRTRATTPRDREPVDEVGEVTSPFAPRSCGTARADAGAGASDAQQAVVVNAISSARRHACRVAFEVKAPTARETLNNEPQTLAWGLGSALAV